MQQAEGKPCSESGHHNEVVGKQKSSTPHTNLRIIMRMVMRKIIRMLMRMIMRIIMRMMILASRRALPLTRTCPRPGSPV